MSYSRDSLGIWQYIVSAGAQAADAAFAAGAGVYKKEERAAKSNLQAARSDLQAAQATAAATEQAAQITAEGAVDAAQIRIAAAKATAAKQQKTLILGGAVVALGVGAMLLLSGGSRGA